MISYKKVEELFKKANKNFISNNQNLLYSGVSERTLCGALMLELHDLIKKDTCFNGYYSDVEYNRNKGSLKTIKKEIRGNEYKKVTINCDLIVHSRGEIVEQDNLLAIEMKKSSTLCKEREQDRERLIALTKDSFDDIWAFDGQTLPDYVCRYVLGVYYEINYNRKIIKIEYYKKGKLESNYTLNFNGWQV